jgi:peptidoglycan lytic transglycosylase
VSLSCFVILFSMVLSEPCLQMEKTFEVGSASYYAGRFEGNHTASGAVFRQSQLTAAHRTLPFGTKLLVTNLKNNRSVVVTVNDRGPVPKRRILDLSFAGARQLRMVGSGVVPVRAEVLDD